MAQRLLPDASSVGIVDLFSGNFTRANLLRSLHAAKLELLMGYGSGRLAQGWWLLFALERPATDNFELLDDTGSSGRADPPERDNDRPQDESEFGADLGDSDAFMIAKAAHVIGLQIMGPYRLARVLPVAGGNDNPVGTGIYQCRVPRPIRCRVAEFIAPGRAYRGAYA